MIEAPNGPGNLLLCPLYRLHQGGRVARVGCPEGQAFGERRPGRVGGLGDAEVAARLLGVLPELLVGQRVLRRRGADDAVLLRQQPGRVQVEQAGQQLAPGQVAGRAEQHDDVVVWFRRVVPARRHEPQAFFSACPPNSERIAERIFPVNAPRSLDSNRSYSEAAMTEAGTPSSTAASTVHRPSPESDTRPLKSDRSGDLANAAAVRSTSQELTTEPRRHTSATSPTSITYWYASGLRS